MKFPWLFPVVLMMLPMVVPGQELGFREDPEGILISEGDHNVLYYQKEPVSLKDEYERANYIHPLYGLDGEVLTEDFPEDHRHHRGIFWAWHQVLVNGQKMGDSWACQDFSWEVASLTATPGESGIQLRAKTFWESPSYTDEDGTPKPFLQEETKVLVHPRTEHYRVIDFTISLLALVPDLQLGGSEDNKGYGGFSVRMKLPEDVSFRSATGAIEPREEAVTAAPWMDISGSLGKDGSKAGIIIISGNEWDRERCPWILRKEGSMQNPVFPGRKPVPVSDREPTVLRYRLVLYQGDISPEEINALNANE